MKNEMKLTSLYLFFKDYAVSLKDNFQNFLHVPEIKVTDHALSDSGDRNHNSNGLIILFNIIRFEKQSITGIS